MGLLLGGLWMRGIFLAALSAAIFLSLQSCSVLRVFSAESSPSLIPSDTLKSRYSVRGIIEDKWVDCSVDGPSRRHIIIYLPSDYYTSGKSYPVVYLFHGARGNELSWITDGHVFNVIDSLKEVSQAAEAVFVLPNMNQYDNDEDERGSRFKQPFESLFDTNGAVETGFHRDVMDYIESHYRIIRDKRHRAIAGLSIGAFQAAYISALEPDLFDYVGLFSPFFLSPVKKSPYSDFYTHLEDKWKKQFAPAPRLYFLAIGKWDIYYEHIWNARGYMERQGYPFDYYEGPGGHDWNSWPVFFGEFYKKIFKDMDNKPGIAVFMGSADGEGDRFMEFARNFGRRVAAEHIPVVYGGANVGTMGAFADGVLSAGGDVTGVFPTGFGGKREVQAMNLEIEYKGLSKVLYVKDFAERKQTMENLSCCCLALPGSIGTMDELFCYAVNNEIGLHDKPCFVLNLDGYYDGLKFQLETMKSRGFLPGNCGIIRFVSSVEEFLEEYSKL